MYLQREGLSVYFLLMLFEAIPPSFNSVYCRRHVTDVTLITDKYDRNLFVMFLRCVCDCIVSLQQNQRRRWETSGWSPQCEDAAGHRVRVGWTQHWMLRGEFP